MKNKSKVDELLEGLYPYKGNAGKRRIELTKKALLQELLRRTEELLELHTHDSIPSYTAGLEECCSICIRNKAIQEVQEILKGVLK